MLAAFLTFRFCVFWPLTSLHLFSLANSSDTPLAGSLNPLAERFDQTKRSEAKRPE